MQSIDRTHRTPAPAGLVRAAASAVVMLTVAAGSAAVWAIRGADGDGNASTEADPAWEPFMPTPPVPDYPSTHTVLGAAAAEVLIRSFGDAVPFSATSLTLPGVTRHFRKFSEAARENGDSRVYAGIHFERAVQHGYRQGRKIGSAVSKRLRPLD
jgi:hypothetical protein